MQLFLFISHSIKKPLFAIMHPYFLKPSICFTKFYIFKFLERIGLFVGGSDLYIIFYNLFLASVYVIILIIILIYCIGF